MGSKNHKKTKNYAAQLSNITLENVDREKDEIFTHILSNILMKTNFRVFELLLVHCWTTEKSYEHN